MLAKGWCSLHYQRVRVHGDPDVQLRRPTRRTLVERVAELEATATRTKRGCLIPRLKSGSGGYVPFQLVHADGTKQQGLLHRVAYELRHGPIPAGLLVRHTCDVRACFADRHLSLGTAKQNGEDASERQRVGLHPKRRGHLAYLLDKGHNDLEIARILGVSQTTVRSYRKTLRPGRSATARKLTLEKIAAIDAQLDAEPRLTLREIAECTGVTDMTVHKQARRRGLVIPKLEPRRNLTDEQRQEIVRRARAGESDGSISRAMGFTHGVAARWRKRLAPEVIRRRGGPRGVRRRKED